MALFESESTRSTFPTLPAFTVAVQVKDMPQYGLGQCGIVALKPIPAKTKFWVWTDRVERVHHSKLHDYLEEQTGDIQDADEKQEAKRIILRQGFVLPNSKQGDDTDEYFCTNPTDAGRFMNHSSNPNCGPDGTLRDIQPGEEMTMDYAFHGNPKWYQAICHEFGVQTEHDIAQAARR